MNNEICRILTGGRKYDTTDIYSDTDYLVIVDKDIEFERIYDEVDRVDYLCYGKNFIEKLLNKEATHYNLPYVLLEMANQDVYPTKYDLFGNIDYTKQVYVQWLTNKRNSILKNLKASKRIFYAFVLMYWVKNNAYKLTNKQQEIVNNVHQRIDIDEKVIDEFIEFYSLDKWFKKELVSLIRCWKRNPKKIIPETEQQEKKLQLTRAKREKECFPIINRGQLWYSTLTAEQYKELQVWYKAWLDVTETLVIPEKPRWLE